MLPEIGKKLDCLPRRLAFVRALEEFEGPILSHYKAAGGGGVYVEKYCATFGLVSRFLIVRSDQRAIAEFLAGSMTMLALLKEHSDGAGWLVDRAAGQTVGVTLAVFSDLPRSYLPTPTRKHDPDLRPEWDVVPQSYLLDAGWDGKTFAAIERHYFNAEAFAYHTKPNATRHFPVGVLGYEYDGGYSVMHALNAMRGSVPRDERSRSGGVSANSPGVLTIDAPAETATRLASALRALPRAAPHYKVVHEWSRLSPTNAEAIPETAREDVKRLCAALDVDPEKLYPFKYDPANEKDVVLVAGKLISAYYRVLLRVMSPAKGVEFTGVKLEELPEVGLVEAQEDEDEVVVLRG